MDIEIKSWLYDIITAIEEINSFITATPGVNHFENDLKTKRAVERNIEIIGEAVSRILNKDAGIPLSNSR
jgi:uncharacterized protein with HEPN domain